MKKFEALRRYRNPKMDHDFLTNLPREIMIDILLRLPIGRIMRCKCVCKSWLDLIKTREFVESHSSRSVPCLALSQRTNSNAYKIIEYLDTQNSGVNHCNMVLNFNFPHILHGSANGLLFLLNNTEKMPFVCNPITREYVYVKLPPPVESNIFGFGVSKLTGEYKVARLFYEDNQRKCEVYSLRIGFWRSVVTADDQLRDARCLSSPISLNGNLHWLVGPYQRILCFDLETECFSSFSIPRRPYSHDRTMCALGDCLCLCDNSRAGFVIWSMVKYGDDESWTKEFIEIQDPYEVDGGVVPIKVFKDGDILFLRQYWSKLYYYSSKTRTVREVDAADEALVKVCYQTVFIYTPSFVSLKTLTMKNNVISF